MILMYHNIADNSAFNTVSLKDFEQQLEFIRNSERYTILSLNEYVDNLFHPTVKNPLTVTFDDAYINLKTLALPVIVKFNIPISIFIPVGFVGLYNSWDTENGNPRIDIMDWKSLREISQENLITIGSHGMNHLSHGKLTEEMEYYELKASKEILENNLDIEVKYFSFPFGQLKDIGVHSIKNLENLGYRAALSTIWSRNNSTKNRYLLNRLEILGTDDLNTFIHKLESIFYLKYYKQQLKSFLYKTKILK